MNILHLSVWNNWLFILRKCNCYSKICASIILPIRNGLWGILNGIIRQNDTPQIQLKQALTYFLNPNTSIVYVPLNSRNSFPSINVVLIILFLKEDSKSIINFLLQFTIIRSWFRIYFRLILLNNFHVLFSNLFQTKYIDHKFCVLTRKT